MTARPPELDDVDLGSGVTPLPSIRPVGSLLIACVPLAVAVALVGLAVTGATTQTLIVDPGDLVTYGLPVARVVHDLAASVTIGLLVIAAFALPGQGRVPGALSFVQFTAVRWAAGAAGVWFVAGCVVIVLTAASVIGVPLTDPIFRRQFVFFATGLELGQSLLVSTVCVLAVLVISYLTRSVAWAGAAAALSLFALLPLSLSGHAAGSDEHANAVNSLAIHLLGVTVWVGGLVSLIVLREKTGRRLPVVAARYSALAGWCFAAVALSGVVNVSLRFTGIGDLVTTEYGLLVSAKIVVLVTLGVAGALHRRRVIPGLVREPTRRRSFVRLAVAEVVLMAVAMGLSVALSRSAPPVPQTSIANVDPRSSLIGFTFPEPVSVSRMLTAFHPDWAWLAIAGVLAGLYLAGVVMLRRRGDRWSAARTVPWVAGSLLLAYATSGGPGVYGAVHFSTHMIQHMLLMMYVPPLLVLGAPVTLLLRLVPARRDHSRGVREWVLVLTHSRYARLVTHPVVAAVVFAGSLIAFYYTGWFRWSLETHQGHLLMTVHFLISGYLFFFVLIGIDPGPTRPPYPMRLIILLATMAFHAFFGLAIMSGTEVLALDWWHALDATDDAALLADQVTGGGIAWGTGELPVVLVALMVVRQWSRSEERAAKRYDRKADRDDDATLRAYNDQLARLNGTDTPRRER